MIKPSPVDSEKVGDQSLIERIVVINDLSQAKGGATGLALLSAELLHERGFKVTFICGDDATAVGPQYAGIDFVPVGAKTIMKLSKPRAAVNGIYNSATVTKISRWIADNDTERTVYHLHGWSKILSPSVFKALRPVLGRLVIHAHDFFIACPNGAFFDYKRHEICERKPLGANCLASQCDKRNYVQKIWRSARQLPVSLSGIGGKDGPRVLMIHETMRPFLLNSGFSNERLRTVRNPFRRLSTSRITVEDNHDIFFVGRVEEEKGIEDLAIASEMAGARLRVVGDGPLASQLQERFPRVDWLGWRTPGEIGELLRSARCTVMPSRYPEPFGLVALEALTSGVPVLFSRHAFLAKEAQAAGYAFTADTRNHFQLADMLTRIASMPSSEIQAMSQRAFEQAASLATTSDEWVETLIGEYHETLSNASARTSIAAA